MKRLSLLLSLLCLVSCAQISEKESSKERYFGLHFDFHASPDPSYEKHPIGSTLSADEIREICRNMGIDFLQIDCKGHPGWASYPTKCGNAMPYIEGDPLKVWRKVTKEEGVKLFLHYSGVWDYKYASENPSEAVMLPDGTRSTQATRTNGKYVDELLIPQLKELAGEYGIDGMWIDGECWGTQADFDPVTIAQFEKETGIDLKGTIPNQRGGEYFNEYRDWSRDLFRRYLNKYVNALHADYPDFMIASNWAFTDHMPEKVCADVDFISGDFTPDNSYWWARYSGRSMEKQGKPWDLMAWGFRLAKEGGHIYKSIAQMKQEAAGVISLGGGFQVYITQLKDGSPRMDRVRALYDLSEFMRERKDWCFGGHIQNQVAVLLSTFDRNRESESLFSRNGCEKTMNLVNLLCDAGHSVSIVSEHDLVDGKVSDWPVIAVPELYEGLTGETFELLVNYVKDGGSLLLCGQNTCKLFAQRGLPCKTLDQDFNGERLFHIGGDYGLVSGGKVLADNQGKIISTYDGGLPFMAIREYGKGKVAAVSCDIAGCYASEGQQQLKHLADEALIGLYEPMVSIESSAGSLEIVDMDKDGKTLIQLVNTNGLHHAQNSLTEESIPPVCDVCLKIKLDNKPSALRLQPEGKRLKFKWADGYAYVKIPRIDYHCVLEIVR